MPQRCPGACAGIRTNAARWLGLATLAAPLLGAHGSVVAGTPQQLSPVDVRGVLLDDIARTPGAAALLDAEDIERLRPYSLHDALDFIPGVRTIDDDALGLRSGIGVRGAPPRRSRKTLLLEDGSPISASNYLDPSAHYTPPMERLDRIEVLKGAGQLVHGPLNNHGIVNFRNKRPTPLPETTVELAGGELGTFRRHLMHRRTDGAVGSVLSYSGANADGVFDVEEHQFDDFHAGIVWALSERQELDLSGTYFRERSDGYDEANLTPEQFAENPRNKRSLEEGREFNNISVDYRKFDATHRWRISERLRLSSKAFSADLDRPRFQTRGTPPTEDGVMEGRDRRYQVHGAESRLNFAELRSGNMRHEIEGGLRFERHLFDDRRPVGRPGEALNRNRRGNVFATSGEDGFTRDGRLVKFQASAASAYLQNTLRVGDWAVTPGLRAERFLQQKETRFRPGSSSEGEREREWNTLLLPGVSLLYDGWERRQAYAGVHRGYAPAPARSEEFPLVPEKGVNTQVGVRSSEFIGLRYEVALFYNRIKDTLIRDDVDDFGDALFINAVDSDIYGVDLDLRMDSRPYTGALLNIYTQLAYNFTEANFRTGPLDGNRVPEIPRHVGSLTIGMEHPAGWHVSATVSHFGDFFADKENTESLAADGGRVPSRTLFSARASYILMQVPGAPSIWLQGRNLADRLYVSDVQDGLRPGAARSVIAGATLRF